MSRGTEPGNVRGAASVFPVLIECDRKGRIRWMSDAARSQVGNANDLGDTLLASWATSDRSSGVSLGRVLHVLNIRDSVVVTLLAARPGDEERWEWARGLLELQGRLLAHYFRLQNAERRLTSRARKKRGRTGPRAVRQLEMERQRLGRELHTGLGQMLAAIRLQLEVVRQQIPQPPAAAQQAIERIGRLASEGLDQVRSISRRLHPPEWQRLKLAEALRQLWEVSGIPQSYEAVLRVSEPEREPELEIKVLLYRAAQEAISNIARHSRATRIEMILDADPYALHLEIRDNGMGFDAAALCSAPASVAAGLGLRSIREQAESLGAKVEIESGPRGTTLKVSAPYTPAGS